MLAKSTTINKKVLFPLYDFLNKVIGAGPINWPILALARFLLSFIIVSIHIVPYASDIGLLNWVNRLGFFNAIFGFLLISGLSIGKSILKNKEGYFLRRVQRIYPIYLASILLHYIVLPEEITSKFAFTIIGNIFFLNQLIMPTSYVGAAWTLSLEVWLYISAPFLLLLSYKRLLIITCISFVSYCLYTCGRTLFHWPYFAATNYGINILLLSFIWIAGFMLAIFDRKIKKISLIIGIIFIFHFILTFSILILHRIKHQQVSYIFKEDIINSIFEIICLSFIYFIVIGNRNISSLSLSSRKIFNFLGNISYPLYVTHVSILDLCKKFHINNCALLVSFCLMGASIIYWLFDFYSRKRIA